MIDRALAPYAATLLRVALGVMFLAHSLVLKLLVLGLEGNAQFFASLGLPAWSGYLVFAAETVGGAMLVLGIQARWVALALTPVLAGATWAHWGNGWMFGYTGGGWEYPLYLMLLGVAQFLLGDGHYALRPSRGLPQWLRHGAAAELPRRNAVDGGAGHV